MAPARAKRDDADLDWLNHQGNAARTPEERLAISKLLVMFWNIGGSAREQGAGGNKSQHPQGHKGYLRDEAYNWFFGHSDFEQWCDEAGFDPDYVREKAMKVYENGLPEKPVSKAALWQRANKAKKRREKEMHHAEA